MRNVEIGESAPPGAIRVVGMLGGEVLGQDDWDYGLLGAVGFEGDPGTTQLVVGPAGPVIVVGLGDEVDEDTLRDAAGAAARTAPRPSVLATSLHQIDIDGAVAATVQGFRLGSYSFDSYRSGDKSPDGDVILLGDVEREQLDAAVTLTASVGRARDWVNRPAADKAPSRLGEEMAAVLAGVGYEVEIWDEERIAAERLGGVVAVSAGSDRPARILVGRRRPANGLAHLALVGKGIVFDSGGLSLKTATAMEMMKVDMAGGAAVVGGAEAIGALGLALDVSVFVPLTDNMPGGAATKPGDVLTARNGKTIEVVNTDCEGRLVLADALSLAVESDPDLIVDVATLTGGSRVALGDRIAALFTSGVDVTEMIEGAASRAGERIWPLPLPADYRKLIDSTVADMKNQGGRSGSAITAALLLAEFTGDRPWAHIDMAAPATFVEDGPAGPRGASGFGVATIVALAQELSAR